MRRLRENVEQGETVILFYSECVDFFLKQIFYICLCFAVIIFTNLLPVLHP